ncbi:BTAD domain-containing putative transcriptional regulator [Leptothoe sp. ISB3NOV94-8A]
MSIWTLQLLGQFQVKNYAGVIQSFRTQKTAKLLAFLVYFYKTRHSREQLVDMLWPENSPENGRNSLRVSLHSLRQKLSTSQDEIIISNGDTVQINAQYFITDTWQISTLLNEAKNYTDSRQRLKILEKVVQRDYGTFLSQYDDDWIMPERHYWQTIYLDTLHQLVDSCLELNELTAASAYAHLAVKADSYAEQAHADLIRTYMAMGRPIAARSQYQELKRIFQQELNLPISDFIRDIAKQFGLCNGYMTLL